jgi:sugar lactone lactonase YvrE
VYDSSTLSYTRLGDIVIDGLKAANDLAADPDRKLLFVADRSMRIWKVDVSTSRPTSTELFQTTFSPSALWFNHITNQLVIVGEGASQVYVYNVNGGGIQNIVTLPRDLKPNHAVATASGTFLVAHTALSMGNSLHDNVTEFSASGEVLRSFGGRRGSGTEQLNTPRHLALKTDDGLLVADWLNGRIVRLDNQLNFAGYVVEGVPVTRLCLAEQRGLLIAGLTKHVAIYIP